MTPIELPWHERLIADRCEHGIPFAKECRECYRIYESEEGTRQ